MVAELRQQQPSTAPIEGTKEAEVAQPLDAIVAKVSQDSRKDSERYLEETTVPHGGE